MSKTYTELIEEISPQEIDELYEYALFTEKNLSKDEVADLIDSAISAATKVKNDPKKSDKHKKTASSVLSKVRPMKKTFEKDGSIHPNAVNSLMRVVTGVHSGRYGKKKKNNPKVPQNYAREEDETLQEGMTGSIAKVLAMGLKRKVIAIGNQVESAKDLGEKIEHLSKQINVIAGLVLTTISVSDEKGLLSKGAILTSLFSSQEPDINNIDLDTLFEECV
jgi:hypothetical protein